MSPRLLPRIALHLLLAVSLVIPGVVSQAQTIAYELQAAAATATMADAIASDQMPCDDMDMLAPADGAEPDDCCTPQSCDLSACLGTACLPQLPRIAAAPPLGAAPPSWLQSIHPIGVSDTPLRPPIA